MSEVIPTMGEDEVLAYTQSKRKEIVEHLTKDKKIPEDGSSRDMLLRALDGLDKAAFGKKRLQADERNNGNMAAMMAKLLTHLSSNKNLPPADVIDNGAPPPALGSDIPNPVLVPGETEVSAPQMDYDTFMAPYKDADQSNS